MSFKMKNKIAILCSMLFSIISLESFAQVQEEATVAKVGGWEISEIVLMVVLASTITVLLILLYVLYALNIFLASAKQSGDIKGVPAILKFTDAVPVEREHEILMDHDYDGIRELDNRLPPWWVYMFYGTIVFALFYMWYYHISGTGSLQEEEFLAEMKQAEIELSKNANRVDENSVTLLTDKERLKSGEEIYIANCAPCHGKKGEGGVGPNFADNYWIHGADIKDVFKTIKYGVPEKGMIPWQTQISPKQIQEVASFVITFKGTNPPNQKEAQGEKVE